MIRRAAVALILSAAVATAGAVWFKGADASSRPKLTYSDSGLEPQLAKILSEIEGNRLESALQLTESLLNQYPTFRLGHLIKGDLLLGFNLSTLLYLFDNKFHFGIIKRAVRLRAAVPNCVSNTLYKFAGNTNNNAFRL